MTKGNKDNLFAGSNNPVTPGSFMFDSDVVNVFDDMIDRSTPVYKQMQQLLADIILYYNNKGIIYDIGCSTCTTFKNILLRRSNLSLVAIDLSDDMLNKCKTKLREVNGEYSLAINKYDIVRCDFISCGIPDVVVLSYVLQFIALDKRQQIINYIYEKLSPEGCLILVEKITSENSAEETLFSNIHTMYKVKKGYTQEEINNKRVALENVLIPITVNENMAMLKNAGFNHVFEVFKWCNFAAFVAIKK